MTGANSLLPLADFVVWAQDITFWPDNYLIMLWFQEIKASERKKRISQEIIAKTGTEKKHSL